MRIPSLLHRFTLLAVLAALVLAAGGCASSRKKKKDYEMVEPAIYLEVRANEMGVSMQLPVSGVMVSVRPKIMFTRFDITSAELVNFELGKGVFLQFTPQAQRDLYRFTGTNQGGRLVLTLNSAPVGVRVIDHPFAEGGVFFFLELEEEILPELVKNLQATVEDAQEEIARK